MYPLKKCKQQLNSRPFLVLCLFSIGVRGKKRRKITAAQFKGLTQSFKFLFIREFGCNTSRLVRAAVLQAFHKPCFSCQPHSRWSLGLKQHCSHEVHTRSAKASAENLVWASSQLRLWKMCLHICHDWTASAEPQATPPKRFQDPFSWGNYIDLFF